MQGGAGEDVSAWVCGAQRLRPESLGPKAMYELHVLAPALPARRAIPHFYSSGAASCIAFAALDRLEP